MSFPKWAYHKDKELSDKSLFQDALPDYGARIFQSQAELDLAGEGWVDSPSEFIEFKVEPITKGDELSVKIQELRESDLSPSLEEEIGKVKKKGKK